MNFGISTEDSGIILRKPRTFRRVSPESPTDSRPRIAEVKTLRIRLQNLFTTRTSSLTSKLSDVRALKRTQVP